MKKNSKMIKGTAVLLCGLNFISKPSRVLGKPGNINFNTSLTQNNSYTTNNTYTKNKSYSTVNNYNSNSYTSNHYTLDTESEESKRERTKMASDSYRRGQALRSNAELTSATIKGGAVVASVLVNSWNDDDPTWKKVLKGIGIGLCIVLPLGLLGFSYYLSYKNAVS